MDDHLSVDRVEDGTACGVFKLVSLSFVTERDDPGAPYELLFSLGIQRVGMQLWLCQPASSLLQRASAKRSKRDTGVEHSL
jgi:hypothetical protein